MYAEKQALRGAGGSRGARGKTSGREPRESALRTGGWRYSAPCLGRYDERNKRLGLFITAPMLGAEDIEQWHRWTIEITAVRFVRNAIG